MTGFSWFRETSQAGGQKKNLLIAPSQFCGSFVKVKKKSSGNQTWNQFISAPPPFSSPPLFSSAPSSLQKKNHHAAQGGQSCRRSWELILLLKWRMEKFFKTLPSIYKIQDLWLICFPFLINLCHLQTFKKCKSAPPRFIKGNKKVSFLCLLFLSIVGLHFTDVSLQHKKIETYLENKMGP